MSSDQMEEQGCPNCGSSTTWVDCENCDEFGMSHHDCGEDSCCCRFPEDNVPCRTCGGHGGWLECISSPLWCTNNPIATPEKTKAGT